MRAASPRPRPPPASPNAIWPNRPPSSPRRSAMPPTPKPNAKPAREIDMTEVKVPTLGESITEATLGAWLKQPGEAVAQDEPIASLETDKVAVEVPSPVAGTMGDQLVKVGDTVAVGAVIANINAGAAATPANPPGPGETPELRAAEAAPPAPAAAADEQDEGSNLTLSPAVRRVVLEHHLDPSKIKG